MKERKKEGGREEGSEEKEGERESIFTWKAKENQPKSGRKESEENGSAEADGSSGDRDGDSGTAERLPNRKDIDLVDAATGKENKAETEAS